MAQVASRESAFTGWMPRAIRLLTGAILLAVLAPAEAAETVVLRAGNGRFLRAAEDGTVPADRLFPGEEDTFELVPADGDRIVLKAPDGRLLAADGENAIRLRDDTPSSEPGDGEPLTLVHVDANRVGLKAGDSRRFVRFVDPGTNLSEEQLSAEPGPDEVLEVFRAAQVPSWICSGLALAIRGLVMEELADQEYHKTRTKKRKQYIELPAPTLRDLGRTKRHRVLSMTEEYHLRARLDGTPDIRITRMVYLKGYFEPTLGLLMFDVEAEVPVSGRVRYKIPNALSASTGYRTVVGLSTRGEVRAEKSGDRLSLSPPELLDLRVRMHKLDPSNDVLHLVRSEIEDLANRELRSKSTTIRQKANKAIAKAVEATEFQHPLLKYLALP